MTQPSRIDGLPDLPKPRAHAFSMEYSGPIFDTDQVNAHGLACYEAGSAAAAQAAKQVPAGFVLVPREPTSAMEVAGEAAFFAYPQRSRADWAAICGDAYRAMLDAAPSATSLAEDAEAGQVEAETLDMPEDDEARNAWVSACEVDGIKYSGSAFERGWELALSNGVPEWPTWANQILKVVREHSGYDGYDEQDGVDLVEETSECLRELAAMADRARAALAAIPASSQAPAPQVVVGEASEALVLMVDYAIHHGWPYDAQKRIEGIREADKQRAAPTPSPAPSAAPHQGADALREAALIEAADALFDFQEIGGFVPKANREEFRELCGAVIVDYLHRAALAQHQAPQQGEPK